MAGIALDNVNILHDGPAVDQSDDGARQQRHVGLIYSADDLLSLS